MNEYIHANQILLSCIDSQSVVSPHSSNNGNSLESNYNVHRRYSTQSKGKSDESNSRSTPPSTGSDEILCLPVEESANNQPTDQVMK